MDGGDEDLVALTRRVVEAGNERDVERILGFYSRDSIWDLSAVGLGVYEGRAAMRDLFEGWWGGYAEYEQVVEDVRDLGNGVTFGIYAMRGRAAGSSAWVELRYGAATRWCEGSIELTVNYLDIDSAREAAERLARQRDGA
jgi:hypothetical protein